MFLGNHEASFDAKNRVNFPAKLRDKIPEAERRSLILAWQPPDPCLVLYTASEWARITSEIAQRSRAAREWDRNVDRHLYGNATDLEIDAVGRILVPEKFRNWAGIGKAVVFAGVRNCVELWDERRWNARGDLVTESEATVTVEQAGRVRDRTPPVVVPLGVQREVHADIFPAVHGGGVARPRARHHQRGAGAEAGTDRFVDGNVGGA